jgi:hypothetical protein
MGGIGGFVAQSSYKANNQLGAMDGGSEDPADPEKTIRVGNKNRNWVSQAIALRMTAPTTLTNGIIAYWKLNGDSTDATGNGNNGTDTSVTYDAVDGKINQGALFNRASNSKVVIADSTALRPTNSFTANAWIKLNPTTGTILILQSYSQSPSVAAYKQTDRRAQLFVRNTNL